MNHVRASLGYGGTVDDINILQDLIYQNPGKSGSILYVRSCRIYIINSSILGFDVDQGFRRVGPLSSFKRVQT